MTKYGYERSPYGNFSTDMEVLAGYDSSSSTEEDKIQRKLASGEVRDAKKRYTNISVMLMSCYIVFITQKKLGMHAKLW